MRGIDAMLLSSRVESRQFYNRRRAAELTTAATAPDSGIYETQPQPAH